jgi:site-specific recombinase XerD
MAEFLGRPPEDLVPADIRAWDDEMNRRGNGPDWLGIHIAALKFLYRRTLGRPDMVSFLTYARVRRRLPAVLGPEEVSRLLAAFRLPRYRAFYSLIFDTGLRISEAADLTAGDIDQARGVIHVRHGKGDKERQVKLGDRLYQLLRVYWCEVRMKDPHPERLSKDSLLFICRSGARINFPSARNALRLAAQEAGLTKRVTPHTLRHCFATAQLEAGTDLSVVQAQLGHADLSSTQIYLHVSTRLIRQAPSPLDTLPPP